MVNRDNGLDISTKISAIDSANLYVRQTDKDQQLIYSLIQEVNNSGYHIQYMFQLQALDKTDMVLVPILLKYYGKFDYDRFNMNLLGYLGKRGVNGN